METRTLIEPTAQVITITKLSKGDVYKRLVKNYSDTYDLRIGVVTDVMHNGSEAALTALEFSSSYMNATAEIKVFGGDNDLALFHADPAEIEAYLGDVLKESERTVESKRKEVEKAELVSQTVRNVMLSKHQLTAPVVHAVEE